MQNHGLYGLLAEFDNPKMDAYTPMPVHGLAEALGSHRTRVPLLVLLGGLFGCGAAYAMLYVIETYVYPLNVGGRPYNSWPAFIPITFETTVLFAALAAVFGMLALNGLPRPHHPIFNAPRFALASHDRFFLCIEAGDPKFELDAARTFLEGLHAREVTEVER